MCNLSKGVWEEAMTEGFAQGISQGISQGILLTVKNLMSNMHWSASQAMDAAGIPESEKEKYLEELQKNL